MGNIRLGNTLTKEKEKYCLKSGVASSTEIVPSLQAAQFVIITEDPFMFFPLRSGLRDYN